MTGKPVRALITGSRDFVSRSIIADALTVVRQENPGVLIVVVHGEARGADRTAGRIAADNPGRLLEEKHPAHWRTVAGDVNKAAGFIRNQAMVDAGADVCLAFYQTGGGNRGTADCVRRAVKAGIPVREHWSA